MLPDHVVVLVEVPRIVVGAGGALGIVARLGEVDVPADDPHRAALAPREARLLELRLQTDVGPVHALQDERRAGHGRKRRAVRRRVVPQERAAPEEDARGVERGLVLDLGDVRHHARGDFKEVDHARLRVGRDGRFDVEETRPEAAERIVAELRVRLQDDPRRPRRARRAVHDAHAHAVVGGLRLLARPARIVDARFPPLVVRVRAVHRVAVGREEAGVALHGQGDGVRRRREVDPGGGIRAFASQTEERAVVEREVGRDVDRRALRDDVRDAAQRRRRRDVAEVVVRDDIRRSRKARTHKAEQTRRPAYVLFRHDRTPSLWTEILPHRKCRHYIPSLLLSTRIKTEYLEVF